MKFSIVIPTLNESVLIDSTIKASQAAGADEIIVCDGGSSDTTVSIAEGLGCRVIETELGRGRQLHAGAAAAKGDIFVFVHADSQLGPACLDQINACLPQLDPMAQWGCFRQQIRLAGRRYRWLESGNAWRASKRGYVYGDQALWIHRNLYEDVGGFAEVPLMEDVLISETLRKRKPPVLLPGPVSIPGRHWEKRGVIRTTIRNWSLFIRYRMGTPPAVLAKRY